MEMTVLTPVHYFRVFSKLQGLPGQIGVHMRLLGPLQCRPMSTKIGQKVQETKYHVTVPVKLVPVKMDQLN